MAIGGGAEVLETGAGPGGEGAPQFVAFTIVAAEAGDMDGADAEGGEIVEDGAGGAGLGADADDIVDREAGFDGGSPVSAESTLLEVTVEADIADDGDAEGGVAAGEGMETLGAHGAGRRGLRAVRGMELAGQALDEAGIVALEVVHRAAHAGVAFAEAQIVGRVIFRRFAGGPIPVAAILEIDDINGVSMDGAAPGLEAQIIDAAQTFLEDLRAHDGGADGEHDAAIEALDGGGEFAEINFRGASDGGAVVHGMAGDDVVADAGMNGEGDAGAKKRGRGIEA